MIAWVVLQSVTVSDEAEGGEGVPMGESRLAAAEVRSPRCFLMELGVAPPRRSSQGRCFP